MITDRQIKDGCRDAYLKAGHNAYFGNGFEAGVKFAIEQVKKCSIPVVVGRSEQFCSCSFVMIMRDEKTDVAYCAECRNEVNEKN